MTWWILVVIFAAIITMVVLWFVSRPANMKQERDFIDSASSDIEIYKNQLAELDSDLKRGLIDEESAGEARLELSRNILAAEKQIRKNASSRYRSPTLKIVIIIAVLYVPVITIGVYSLLGQPGLESHPFNDLMLKNPQELTPEEKLVRTEALFARNPNDGRLADELATGYLVQGRFQDAVNTYVSALRLNGDAAPRLVGYGMALTGFNGGTINDDAQKSFEKAAKLAPDDFYPRLFIAEALRQAGKTDEAIASLKEYLVHAPKDNVGRPRVEAVIKELQNAKDKMQVSPPKEVENNGGLKADGETSISGDNDIEGDITAMVKQLAARLEQQPDDLEGWKKLIHSWLVLKETKKALSALKEGQSKLSQDKAKELASYAKGEGLVLE
ncbi:c-type cytochrome biogenesis protein CcmI [uncultured Bartonella sp.]|uniref:c-type cytochrome biogenesis protein CcmI n=1 Tax=uncultured Bartonella sp. TaxID=104108 RepID=UPI0025EE7A8C|nr:c-type cytochrome biogenesis protein CcmI [uncultured Bartonella sp.]